VPTQHARHEVAHLAEVEAACCCDYGDDPGRVQQRELQGQLAADSMARLTLARVGLATRTPFTRTDGVPPSCSDRASAASASTAGPVCASLTHVLRAAASRVGA